MSSMLDSLMLCGAISPLSRHFAAWIAKRYQLGEDSLVVLTAACVSQQSQLGHVCLDLASAGPGAMFTPVETSAGIPECPHPDRWIHELGNAPCVASPTNIAPLILDENKLYLRRFWMYEQQVTLALLARLEPLQPAPDQSRLLRQLFAEPRDADAVDWQMVASALATDQRLTVISGGPGTGKTTTVVKILALLLQHQPKLHIRLAAPTGKAAARMIESIRTRKSSLNLQPELLARIPDHATTLHRLLGFDGNRFAFSEKRPLAIDCVVVDEASMIDLPLMARLLTALPSSTRIILLGDRDQLASVEAGNILGDITGRGQPVLYSPGLAKRISQACGIPYTRIPVNEHAPRIADSIALLRTSFRFSSEGGIGRLAQLVHCGHGIQALDMLESDDSGQSGRIESTDHTLHPTALDQCVAEFAPVLECSTVEDALHRFGQFRVLCTMNRGELGIERINQQITEKLHAEKRMGSIDQFHGKPIMISVNDYDLELYNGDVGLLWKNSDGSLRAWFEQGEGKLRDYPVRSLPACIPCWAMTIHKAQGSEFDRVLIVLPDNKENPTLSRELLYTGITRARNRVVIHGNSEVFANGCARRIQRSSGLMEKLGWSAVSEA